MAISDSDEPTIDLTVDGEEENSCGFHVTSLPTLDDF